LSLNITIFEITVTGEVCRDYMKSQVFVDLISYIMPVIIFTTDFLLESFAVICIAWIAYDNKTHELSTIQSAVFVLTFFNSALAILLINARFTKNTFCHFLFNGLYMDFSDDWYDQSSEYFVTPMFMEITTPFIDFLIPFIMQQTLSLLDRRFTDKKLYKTQCNIADDYAEINSGIDLELSGKYPQILSISMVACFYGFGLPLLPIMVLVILIIVFIFEKVCVTLYYRKPPLYDATLNKTSVLILKWGSFLYVAIAYWMLTNKQMFDNNLNPIAYKDQIEDYHHYIFEIPPKLQQKILLYYAIGLFAFLIMDDYLRSYIFGTKSIMKEIDRLP
jgi:hypothetical protein